MNVWIIESRRRQKFFLSAHILHNSQIERILNLCARSWMWIVNHRMTWLGIWKFASFQLTRTFSDAQDHPKINKKGLRTTLARSLGQCYFCLLLFRYKHILKAHFTVPPQSWSTSAPTNFQTHKFSPYSGDQYLCMTPHPPCHMIFPPLDIHFLVFTLAPEEGAF